MDTNFYLVRNMSASDRRALEHLVGQPLNDDQRVVIQVSPVASISVTPSTKDGAGQSAAVPASWRVFDGMSDDQLNRLDATLAQRPAFSRPNQ